MVRSGLTIALCWVLLVGAYFLLPIGHESSLRAFVRLGADVALIAAIFAWQIRRISSPSSPSCAPSRPSASWSCCSSSCSPASTSACRTRTFTFTQKLDQTKALYFTITIFSTVGFGDITPQTDAARLVVSAQMLLDLAIIGAAVRLIFNAARSRITPSESGAATTADRRSSRTSVAVGPGTVAPRRREMSATPPLMCVRVSLSAGISDPEESSRPHL